MRARCMIWDGLKNGNGYGYVETPSGRKPIHRIIYEAVYGPIPKGLQIDHLCRVHSCVNPKHLEAVTRKENILRGTAPSAINSRKTECKYGHPFTPDNIYKRKKGRECLICMKNHNRTYRKSKALRNPSGNQTLQPLQVLHAIE